MAYLYGIGASVVIVGAMFKIQHWPGAGPMLIVGLSTEAVIFLFSAFEPLHEDPKWELVYPELASHDDVEHEQDEEDAMLEESFDSSSDEELPVTEQLDKMLEEAKIGPELIESLGSGLRSLSDNASKLTNISDASVATNEYVESVRGAAVNVSQLSESYSKASESLSSISVSSEDGQSYANELKNVSSRLHELGSVYELQLQSSREQLETTKNLYGGIAELMSNLNESIEDTRKYKDNIAELSNNLASLNRVYGNMLNAMNPGNNG